MNDDFRILARFLDRFGAETEGRAAQAITPEIEEALKRLANGKLDPHQRPELMRQLRNNADWVQLLANEVTSLRARARQDEANEP